MLEEHTTKPLTLRVHTLHHDYNHKHLNWLVLATLILFCGVVYLKHKIPHPEPVITLKTSEWKCATCRPATSDKEAECITYWRIN